MSCLFRHFRILSIRRVQKEFYADEKQFNSLMPHSKTAREHTTRLYNQLWGFYGFVTASVSHPVECLSDHILRKISQSRLLQLEALLSGCNSRVLANLRSRKISSTNQYGINI